MNVMPSEIADDVLVTAEGYEQLRCELEALGTVSRAELTEQIRDARLDSDPDNPALYELLEAQAQLEQRIALLEARLAAARVAEPASNGAAAIGSRVRVRHDDSGEVAEYELVGPIESDPLNGRISVSAPVGRALVGGRRGDTVEVETPRGTLRLAILSVRTGARRPLREAA